MSALLERTVGGSTAIAVPPMQVWETAVAGAWGMSTEGKLVTIPVAVPELPEPADRDDSAIRDYVSRLWASDWDGPEDAVYDTW